MTCKFLKHFSHYHTHKNMYANIWNMCVKKAIPTSVEALFNMKPLERLYKMLFFSGGLVVKKIFSVTS